MRRRIGAFLDEGAEIDGRYSCAGTIILNGKLTGEIYAQDTLIVGPTGSVHAVVQAGSLIVHGEIVGNVRAAERVELKRGARVTGDIDAPVIVMEEGVLLEGQCRMDKPRTSEVEPPSELESPSGVVALAR